MRFIIFILFVISIPQLGFAQSGVGKLDHSGKRALKPKIQSSVVPNGTDKAWHFVLPGGSCNRDDCKFDRERSQLVQSRPDNLVGKSYRYGFSFFLPKDFVDVSPTNTLLWEVKPFGTGKPSIVVEIVESRLQFTMSNPGVSQSDKMNPEKPIVIKSLGPIPRGKWTDIKIDVKWSSGKDGSLVLFQNGRKVLSHSGPNVETKVKKQAIMFGIYRSFVSRYTQRRGVQETPTQEAFFSNVSRQEIK